MPNLLKIIEGDYCCLFGYLGLCRARGEKPAQMSKNTGVPTRTLRYHYTILNRGRTKRGQCSIPSSHQCKKRGVDCLHPFIIEIGMMKD